MPCTSDIVMSYPRRNYIRVYAGSPPAWHQATHFTPADRRQASEGHPLLFRCGGDQPNITHAEAGESAKPERLVSRVFEPGIRMAVIGMMQMVFVIEYQQDHEKHSIDDAHRHQEQR